MKGYIRDFTNLKSNLKFLQKDSCLISLRFFSYEEISLRVIIVEMYRVRKNILQRGVTLISNSRHREFYIKWKLVKNGIYWYQIVRVMKTFSTMKYWKIFENVKKLIFFISKKNTRFFNRINFFLLFLFPQAFRYRIIQCSFSQ
jgi:hypothetical protein